VSILHSNEKEYSKWDELRLDFNFNLNRIDTRTRIRVITDLLNDDELGGLLFICGCGVGVESKFFREMGKSVVGLDINRESVKVASVNVPNVSFIVGDATKLPFRDSCFSQIICSAVLEHVPDDAGAILELQRTLEEKGEVVLTTPRRKHGKSDQLVLNEVKEKFGHVREGYTVSDFEVLIRDSQLRIFRSKFYWGPFHELLLKVFELTPHNIKKASSKGIKLENKKGVISDLRGRLFATLIRLLTIISYLDDLTPLDSRSGLALIMKKSK
jgi:2-polyprenyl-3-methyl-5-hydroxy-6-metoxy-1,4-benzoquinol methylase